MELVLTTEDLEPLPSKQKDLITEYSGFLNSEYKSVVSDSLNNVSAKSIFGIRQSIKSRNYIVASSIAETTLKLSVFLTAIVLIFN